MFANKAHEEAYELVKLGKYEDALLRFENALMLNSDSPNIYNDRGVLYIHLKEAENALSDFNSAINLEPNYGYRYSARAYCHDFFGNTEQAIFDYEKAIELDPDDAVAYNNLGLVQEKLGYKNRATSNFQIADKLAKQEENLNQLMYDLENETKNENSINLDQHESTSIIKEETLEDQTKTKTSSELIKNELTKDEKLKKAETSFSEFMKLFTSKEQFNAFLKFLKNGFKIK